MRCLRTGGHAKVSHTRQAGKPDHSWCVSTRLLSADWSTGFKIDRWTRSVCIDVKLPHVGLAVKRGWSFGYSGAYLRVTMTSTPPPAKDLTTTNCATTHATMQNDYCIQASSIRLPLMAAGLVNSALAMLLSQLSNRFFELALADILPQEKSCSPDEPVDTVSLHEEDEESPPTSKPVHVNRTVDSIVNELSMSVEPPIQTFSAFTDTNVVHKQPSSPPLQLLRVKEELDMDIGSLVEHIATQMPLLPLPPSHDEHTFSNLSLLHNAPVTQNSNVPRMTTLTYLKRYACDHQGCGKVFFSRSSLFYHRQSHNVSRTYVCTHSGCNINFTNESQLRSHMQLHQSPGSSTQFVCHYPDCAKVFICHDRLVEHIRTHTGERPYVCDYPGCSYRFARRGNLFAHKRVHVDKTQRRQYHCVHPGCGKTFLYIRSLTEHMNIHMGERPYRCDFPNCDKSFTSKSYLHAHRRIHVSGQGTNDYSREDSASSYMSPFPVTVTVPVPTTGPHQQSLLPFPQASHQSSDFPMFPFFPDHPT